MTGIDDAAGSFGETVVAKALLEGAGNSKAGQWASRHTVEGIEQLLRFLRFHARVFRVLATSARASFSLITNPLRDLQMGTHNTRTGRIPARYWANWIGAMANGALAASGAGHLIPGFKENIFNKYSDFYHRIGMGMTGSLTYDSSQIEINISRINAGGKTTWTKLPKAALELVANAMQFPETASRLAEMKTLAEQRGWDIGQLTQTQISDLVIAGKEVTTDFTRGGKWTRTWNRYVPFFTASIQGKKSAYDAFRRDPVGWVFTRGLSISLKAAATWMLVHDEDWWNEESEQNQLSYDYIPLPKGKDGTRDWLKIPRAHDVDMLFAGGTQAILNTWHKSDPQSLKEWFNGMVEEFSVIGSLDTGINFNALPPVVREAVAQGFNKDFYWKRPLVSQTQQKLEPEEQFGPYTTKVSITAGKILGMSPRRIDHFFAGMIPGAGMDAIATLGRGGSERDGITREWEPSDIPALGRSLFRSGGDTTTAQRSVNALFAAADKVSKGLDSGDGDYTKRDLYKLKDAIQAVIGLYNLERDTHGRAERKALAEERQNIAREAVEHFNDKHQ